MTNGDDSENMLANAPEEKDGFYMVLRNHLSEAKCNDFLARNMKANSVYIPPSGFILMILLANKALLKVSFMVR